MKLRVLAVLAALAMMPFAASATTNLVTNPNFTASTYAAPGSFSGSTTASGWSGAGAGVSTFVGGSGAAFWDNGYVPGQGITGTVGFVQGTGFLTTTLTGLTIGGTYTLSFYANGRNLATPGSTSSFDVTLGNDVGINNPVILASRLLPSVDATYVYDAAFQLFTTTFTASSTSEGLFFNGDTAGQPGDTSVLFADVSVTANGPAPVPEPVSLSLMAMSLLGLGAARRRRS
ncbi:MAG: PEP-CTERM sorting domain-containing protein [Acetobacteraceae bacterium]|nr:PEP-CTERM sorting domain-containing protein [Acetobacteraceae bacterium]